MRSRHRPPAAASHRRQRGSAYITALLVLVVLTIIGLALVLITQTEMQIGANEMTANRTLYAADSGVAVGLAKVLTAADTSPSGVVMNRKTVPPIRDEVSVSGFLPIQDAPCNLCQVNFGSQYYTINHLVTSTAVRRGIDENVPLATRSVSLMVALQPWEGGEQGNVSAEAADPEGNTGGIQVFPGSTP